ncbi:hypothetical protein D7Y13_40475 [Corallococcus praedator]|uniref:Lipoprotein n=1 Tax=Corallococcus praedator TaxID=2316724 RepID=A0ABX9Q400_9BACT|nr:MULTISPECIES: hypothetical protein [Corallococcus]RKH35574.1 hypothetical protein D7X75_04090 [Corallococcus sp. CA031C]RKH89680.1 hypothetical protein D7Y13_40475 [Corallococcus praedator]
MDVKRIVGMIGYCLCTLLVGCAGGGAARIGSPLPLPNGGPRTDCEREGWYDLAPARVQAKTASYNLAYSIHYTQDHVGLGVFKVGNDKPEALDDLWPRLSEPELQRSHEERLEPVKSAHRKVTFWSLASLTGSIAGLGVGAALADSEPTGAAVVAISGLVVGLVGIVGAVTSGPTVKDALNANARDRLLIPGEDDLTAGARAINTLNGERRLRCGGKPVPFPSPPQSQPGAEKTVPPVAQGGAEESLPPAAKSGPARQPITVWPPP